MARIFRFLDSLGHELHTINDPENKLPIPRTMQEISIGPSGMLVESVSLTGTDSSSAYVYSIRVRPVPLGKVRN